MKKKLIASILFITLAFGLVGCADLIGEEAAQAVEDAKQKVMETVKEEINTAVQEVLKENGVEGAEDFDLDDIDFEENMININVQKNKKKSRIPLESRLRKVLLEYIDAWLIYDDDNYVSPYLFPSSYTQSSSRPISRYALSQAIADYNISRGVKKTSCHLFRHTFTKNWILNNGDLHSLQKILGHSTLDMVTKYANLWGEDLKPKVEKYSILATHHQKNSGRMIQRRNRA